MALTLFRRSGVITAALKLSITGIQWDFVNSAEKKYFWQKAAIRATLEQLYFKIADEPPRFKEVYCPSLVCFVVFTSGENSLLL